MNSGKTTSFHFLFDIDGTLTEYRPHALDRLCRGNFLFPLICDLAVRQGLEQEECEKSISGLMDRTPFWDYPDFIRQLELPFAEALELFRKWHRENLEVHPDTVRLIRNLRNDGIPVSIISNNPFLGCLLKLERCGLADAEKKTSCFQHIFSTDIVKGCKGNDHVWTRAVELLALPEKTVSVMVGDNLQEDGILPRKNNIDFSCILNRKKNAIEPEDEKIFIVSSADEIPECLPVPAGLRFLQRTESDASKREFSSRRLK